MHNKSFCIDILNKYILTHWLLYWLLYYGCNNCKKKKYSKQLLLYFRKMYYLLRDKCHYGGNSHSQIIIFSQSTNMAV